MHLFIIQIFTFARDNIWEYLNSFLNLENPIYISLFIVAVIFIFLYLVHRFLVIPLRHKYLFEKKELELKHANLMALFSELDPDPLVRINNEGNIIFSNEIANILLFNNTKPYHIDKIIKDANFNIKSIITNNCSKSFLTEINNSFYSIFIRGSSNLNIAQIYFHDITDIKNYEIELKKSQKHLEDLSNRLQNILESERQRIAAELHDSIGQKILFLKLKIDKILHKFPEDEKTNDFTEITEIINLAIKELRDVVFQLKPNILEEMGLGAALTTLCQKITKDSGIRSSVNVSIPGKRLNNSIEILLYRLAQEAINNICKHSGASEFNIHIVKDHKNLVMIISDDGSGFITDTKNNIQGLGIINMKNRIEGFHGSLKIESSPNSGTVLIFELPFN